MTKNDVYEKEYFEESVYGKQALQIIRRNYNVLLENAANFLRLPQYPQSILDFGCATGVGTIFLSEKFSSANIVGVDVSEYAINSAKMHYAAKNINYYSMDLCRNVDYHKLKDEFGQFDIIFTRDTLEHISFDNQFKLLLNLSHLLKKRGLFIAQTPNANNPLLHADKTHIGQRSGQSWRNLCKRLFSDVIVLEKQYIPFIWRFKNKYVELKLPLFGSNVYIFCTNKTYLNKPLC